MNTTEASKNAFKEYVLSSGFSSVQEYMDMVSTVDTSDRSMFSRFQLWVMFDGTKDGLLKLLREFSCTTTEGQDTD